MRAEFLPHHRLREKAVQPKKGILATARTWVKKSLTLLPYNLGICSCNILKYQLTNLNDPESQINPNSIVESHKCLIS